MSKKANITFDGCKAIDCDTGWSIDSGASVALKGCEVERAITGFKVVPSELHAALARLGLPADTDIHELYDLLLQIRSTRSDHRTPVIEQSGIVKRFVTAGGTALVIGGQLCTFADSEAFKAMVIAARAKIGL